MPGTYDRPARPPSHAFMLLPLISAAFPNCPSQAQQPGLETGCLCLEGMAAAGPPLETCGCCTWARAGCAGRRHGQGGPGPAPRFDHAAAALATVANSPHPDKLVILGGRDSTQGFTDAHMLDLGSMEWLAGHGFPPLGSEVGSSAPLGCVEAGSMERTAGSRLYRVHMRLPLIW